MDIALTIANVVFWVIPILIILLCVLRGARKGLALSVSRLIRVSVSIVLAVVLTKVLITSYNDALRTALTDAVAESTEIASLLDASPSLYNYVTVLVSYLLAPILFLPVYLVVTLVLLIPAAIINRVAIVGPNLRKQRDLISTGDGKKVRVKYKPTAPLSWLWGLIISLVVGVVISAAVFMPFSNYAVKASEYYTALEDSGYVKSTDAGEEVAIGLRSAKNKTNVSLLAKVSSPLFDALTVSDDPELDGSVFKDVDFIMTILPDIRELTESASAAEGEDTTTISIDLSPIKNIVKKLKNTGNLKKVVVEVLSTAGTKWKNGEDFMGIKVSEMIPEEFADYTSLAFDRLAAMSVEDVDNSLEVVNEFVDTFDCFVKAFEEVQALMDTDFSEISDISSEPVKAISDILRNDGTDLAREIIATIMSDAGTAWVSGGEYMGLNIKEQLPDGYKNSLDSALNLLKDTDKDKVCDDLNTFADAINSIKKTYVYVVSLTNVELTKEEMQDNLTDVLKSLTPESVALVSDAINTQMLEDLGMSEQTSEVISDTLGGILSDIANMNDEEKEAEAAALNDIITYVSESSAQTAEPSDLVDSVLSSTIVSNEITKLAEDENNAFEVGVEEKASIDAAIEAYKLENGSALSADDYAVLDAMKDLFTVKLS